MFSGMANFSCGYVSDNISVAVRGTVCAAYGRFVILLRMLPLISLCAHLDSLLRTRAGKVRGDNA